jgi:hypothetical protein
MTVAKAVMDRISDLGELSSLRILLYVREDRCIRSSAASMDQRNGAQTRLWIRDRDSLGNTVDPRLIETAYLVWEQARLRVIRYLVEDTDAPEILDAAVDSASRAMSNGKPIQFFESYLLTSVAREAIRRSRRNRRIAYMDGADLERIAAPVFMDLDGQIDASKRTQRLRACFDELGRAMYDLRVLDYDWRSIARLTGYRDAHSAEVQFRKKLDKALGRFRATHNTGLKPQSDARGRTAPNDSNG